MKNQVLTKEQMNELIALGVDVSKASMCRVSEYTGYEETDESMLVENNKNYYGMSFPVFTVTDMLEMMPNELEIEGYYYGLHVEKYTSNSYVCYYYSFNAEESVRVTYSESMIDAVYMTFIELVKDGKL